GPAPVRQHGEWAAHDLGGGEPADAAAGVLARAQIVWDARRLSDACADGVRALVHRLCAHRHQLQPDDAAGGAGRAGLLAWLADEAAALVRREWRRDGRG